LSESGPGYLQLPPGAREALERVLHLLAEDPGAPSAVTDVETGWRVHIADSLAGLEFGGLRRARSIADVGSGAGFPGIPLAAALPGARVDLIESVARKCAFIDRALERAAITNARLVCDRSEEWSRVPPPDGGREAYEAVTARAVGRMSTLAELAAPLLVEGGVLVAWKGRRDPEEERELERAAKDLEMSPISIDWVGPYAGSENRHIHVVRKRGPTPERLPRRPGIAKKRPLGRLGGR
jgi:16S rRNA (guanine527-N7)-methyltransferase